MTLSSPMYYGSPRGMTPIVVAILGYSTPKRINEILQIGFPGTKMQITYRHLQDWKDRNWVRHALRSQMWTPTVPGVEYMQRIISEQGWPNWLTEAGYSYDMVKIPEPEITEVISKVDPSKFIKPGL